MPQTRSTVLRNAKGREAVFAMLQAITERTGATIERQDYDREIITHVALNGASCMIILDADTARHDFFAGHWHFETDKRAGRLYCDGFDGHGYRAHHKATTLANTAEELCSLLEARFGWIANGSAFVSENEKTAP